MSEKQKMGLGMRITQKQVPTITRCPDDCYSCYKENPDGLNCWQDLEVTEITISERNFEKLRKSFWSKSKQHELAIWGPPIQ